MCQCLSGAYLRRTEFVQGLEEADVRFALVQRRFDGGVRYSIGLFQQSCSGFYLVVSTELFETVSGGINGIFPC